MLYKGGIHDKKNIKAKILWNTGVKSTEKAVNNNKNIDETSHFLTLYKK